MNYQRIYNQIVERGKNRKLEGYKEKHHILPKCLGGDNSKENLVELTAREHFLCHWILIKIHPNNTKLWYALFLMSIGKQNNGERHKLSSRSYENLRLEYISKVKGLPNKTKGIKRRKKTEEERNYVSSITKGNPKPEGFGELLSKIKKGIKNPKNSKKVIQYSLEGEFIKEWESAKEAWLKTKIHYGSISCCCLGRTLTAGKYVWKFKE